MSAHDLQRKSQPGSLPAFPAWSQAVLYGILDTGYLAPEDFVAAAGELVAGGAGVLQIRAKRETLRDIESMARAVLPVARAAGVPLVLNDFAEVAAAVGCDGVHVGQDDASVAAVRATLGPGKIVGKSTHSVAQAVAALAEGADYIGFGPLFATPTKPGRPAIGLADIAEVHRRVNLPIFCIGGIKLARLDEVTSAGARRVVIVSEMLGAPDRERYAAEVVRRMGGGGGT
jgi:thiamine-phosphate pyrophosphorylase